MEANRTIGVGNFLRHWHLGSAYEHWQHCDVSLQSGKYLHPNKVSRILESGTPDFIGYRSPLIADQDEDYVARGNSIVEKLRKSWPGGISSMSMKSNSLPKCRLKCSYRRPA